MAVRKHILFIDLCYFDDKKINKTGNKKLNNWYSILSTRFYKRIEADGNHQNIINNKDNNALFYTGLENDLITNSEQEIQKNLKEEIKFIMNLGKEYSFLQSKYTKTALDKGNKKCRLVSILIYRNFEKEEEFKANNREIIYWLFPLKFVDSHK